MKMPFSPHTRQIVVMTFLLLGALALCCFVYRHPLVLDDEWPTPEHMPDLFPVPRQP